MLDTAYTNGAIAVKEKSLLGEKLLRFAEMNAEEVFRALTESGFGGGAEAENSFAAEALCDGEERELDEFIRRYAPSRAIAEYLLAPRDFHNRKALYKAKLLSADAAPMLAPEGLRTVEELGEELEKEQLLPNGSGAEIGAAFEKAQYAYLFRRCKGDSLLKKLLVGKVDRLNLLTALRARDKEFAEECYLAGGKLGKDLLLKAFEGDGEAFKDTPYRKFYVAALRAKEAGKPFTEAERMLDRFEAEYFEARRYELSGKEPFLYYVFRRRAEIADARVLLVCLNAGLSGNEIKKRLRTV